MNESSQEIGPNPDGHLYPVFYGKRTLRRDGTITSIKTVQIVGTEAAIFPFKAVDPETGDEIPLGETQWVEVYALLNKRPPYDLSQRVAKYYRIRLAEEKKRLRKNTPIETPF